MVPLRLVPAVTRSSPHPRIRRHPKRIDDPIPTVIWRRRHSCHRRRSRRWRCPCIRTHRYDADSRQEEDGSKKSKSASERIHMPSIPSSRWHANGPSEKSNGSEATVESVAGTVALIRYRTKVTHRSSELMRHILLRTTTLGACPALSAHGAAEVRHGVEQGEKSSDPQLPAW